MTPKEYEQMDFYERLILLITTCVEARRSLNKIVHATGKMILEIVEELEIYTTLFLNDVEITSIERINIELKNIEGIIPLLKTNDADYHYLIAMLKSIIKEAESKLPENIQLARFFDKLIANQEKLCEQCDISEEEFKEVLSKLRAQVDEVNATLNPKDKRI